MPLAAGTNDSIGTDPAKLFPALAPYLKLARKRMNEVLHEGEPCRILSRFSRDNLN
jgi:hypothetical protein